MTLRFDYCSDLHIDAWHHTTQLISRNGPQPWVEVDGKQHFLHVDWNWYKTPSSRVLILAGDLSNSLLDTVGTIKDAARIYEHVVFVEGNHDHYQSEVKGDVEDNHVFLKDTLRTFDNVTHLDGMNSLLLDGTLFIGALGWYDWQGYVDRGISADLARARWNSGSNDARYVDFGKFKDPGVLALHQRELLRQQVIDAQEDPQVQDIVVVTHTSPDPELMEWIPGNDNWNYLTPSYMNSGMSVVRDADIQGKIRHWIYGHTHERKVMELNGIIHSNNARGYPRENEAWSLQSHLVRAV